MTRSETDGRRPVGKKRKYLILPLRRRSTSPGGADVPNPEETARLLFSRSRHELIAEAAYYRSQRRGAGPGNPDQDWCEAETEIDELLRRESRRDSSPGGRERGS